MVGSTSKAEDEEKWKDVNFFDEMENDLDVDKFAEVLTVDDGDETVLTTATQDAYGMCWRVDVTNELLRIVQSDAFSRLVEKSNN